jgi:hypothetical protein
MMIDHDEIMRRVASISPALAQNARACDAARQLVPESMRLMVDAGLFKILQPKRVGGYELTMRTEAEAVSALSQACPSSGWVLMASSRERSHGKALPMRSRMDIASTGDGNSAAASIIHSGCCLDAQTRKRAAPAFISSSQPAKSKLTTLGT